MVYVALAEWFIGRCACYRWVFLPSADLCIFHSSSSVAHCPPLPCLVRANTRQYWTKQAGVTELHRGGRLRHAGRHRLGQEHSPHQGGNSSVFTTFCDMTAVWMAGLHLSHLCVLKRNRRHDSVAQEKTEDDQGHSRGDSVTERWSQRQFKVLPVFQKWQMKEQQESKITLYLNKSDLGSFFALAGRNRVAVSFT